MFLIVAGIKQSQWNSLQKFLKNAQILFYKIPVTCAHMSKKALNSSYLKEFGHHIWVHLLSKIYLESYNKIMNNRFLPNTYGMMTTR